MPMSRKSASVCSLACRSQRSMSSGGGAKIVDKFRGKERLSLTLRSSGTAVDEVRNEIAPAIHKEKTGAAPSSCEKWSAT